MMMQENHKATVHYYSILQHFNRSNRIDKWKNKEIDARLLLLEVKSVLSIQHYQICFMISKAAKIKVVWLQQFPLMHEQENPDLWYFQFFS